MASLITEALLADLTEAGYEVVAETDDYFLYASGSLAKTPGTASVHYRLMAASSSGERIRLAEGSISYTQTWGWKVNLGATSETTDPLVLRAKADILNRLADILEEKTR